MIRLSGLVREHGPEGGRLPPDDPRVVYLPSDQGPFACDHCKFFIENRARCTEVAGYIDPHGCCNLFQKNEAHFQQGQQPEQPLEQR